MKLGYVIVFVRDMKTSVSFYKDVMGLSLKFESPQWTEFATEGATLALHVSEKPDSAENERKKVPAGLCRFGLSVPNLNEFHQKMVEKGVPCAQEPKELFGALIAQYVDPDGLTISVGEERSAG